MTPTGSDVVTWLREDFDLVVDDLVPILGGLDPAAAVWQGVDRDGRQLSVKWTRRQTRTGLRLAASLAAGGLDAGPPLIARADGRAWSRRADGRLSVAPWVEGEDAATIGLDLAQWEAYGSLLAAVHRFPFADPGHRKGARRGIRRRRRRFRTRLAELDTRAADRTGDEHRAEVLAAWTGSRDRIALLEAGSRLPVDPAPRSVPCHGDPHLGNVVVGPTGRLRLIDWDEAVVAPPEVDLHLVEFPVLFDPLTDAHRSAFLRGYGEHAPDERRLVRYACVRALEDLVATASAALDGPPDDRPGELTVLRGILSPLGSPALVEPRLRPLLG